MKAPRERAASPAKPGRPRRDLKAALKRGRILEAALEEFAEKGFAAARMEDVARRAKVGKGTLYLYFDDKDALFEGLVHEYIVSPLAELRDVRRLPGEPVGEAVRRVLPPLIAKAASTRAPDLVRLLIGEGVRFPRLADSYRRRVIEPLVTRMRDLLSEGQERGELASEALVRFPQLLLAPALVSIIWTGLFGKALPLDVQAMLDAHLDILFPGKTRTP